MDWEERHAEKLGQLQRREDMTTLPAQLAAIWRERASYYELEPHADFRTQRLVKAWHELNSRRVMGGPIPFDKIDYWADREGLDEDNAMLLRHVINFLQSERAARDKGKRDLDAASAARKGRR